MGSTRHPASATALGESREAGEFSALAAQRGMILNTLRFPDSGVDIIQVTLDWEAPLDRAAFTATWRSAAQRHAILRTCFRLHGVDGVVQAVDPAAGLDVRWVDLGAGPGAADAFVRADRFDRLDLARAPVFRVAVLTSPGGRPGHRIVVTFHHAILDGRSLRMLLGEVFDEYRARCDGREISHLSRPPYAQFVAWWGGIDLTAAATFWKELLVDAPLPRPLPGYRGEYGQGRGEPCAQEIVLSPGESSAVRAAAAAAGVSVNTVMSAAWAVLRGAYSGNHDVVFAVTRSCRHASVPGADRIVGLLINTVPMRIRFNPQWTVSRMLAEVSRLGRELRAHQLAPLASILGWAGLAADTAMLDSLVVFEREGLPAALSTLDSSFAHRNVRIHRLPTFPVTLYVFDEPEMKLSVIWDRRRLVDGSAACLLHQLRAVVMAMSRRPEATLASLSLAAPTEPALLAAQPHADHEPEFMIGTNSSPPGHDHGDLDRLSATPDPLSATLDPLSATLDPLTDPLTATIDGLFAAQVARTPDAAALIAGASTHSYAELDAGANRLAWTLRERGVGTDTAVAIAMHRGGALVCALLAVAKAGGAYVPIDLASPPERIVALLARSGAHLLLTTAVIASALPPLAGIGVIVVDEAPFTAGDGGPAGVPPARSHPLSLAYVSYTSGSTGTPQAVAVAHRAVARLVTNPTFATLGPGERLLQLAPVAFDASTLEIWGALLTGATLVLAPPEPLGLPELAAFLRDREITLAWLTAGLFHQLVEADVGALAGVRQLLAGGDVLSPGALRRALAARGGQPVINGYGPTENTTFTTCHRMSDPDDVGERVPIGRPIQHTSVHILDEDGRPAAIGVAGELYAGGVGLARGYHADPAATARAFLPDPSGHGTRLYRTGDLARWRADGVVEFLGRTDDQVKIRGFRVEPGEVESVLRGHSDVANAVVVVRDDGVDLHLVAYVSAADGTDRSRLSPASLRAFVAQRLPDYLVPAAFAVLDRFPLNANGKVDRSALPPPVREAGKAGARPATATERRLAELWRQVLPTGDLRPARIGRDDGFFAAGGNSLAAARLMFRVRQTFGVDLSLGAFYQSPTLAACAAAIDAASAPVSISRRDRRAFQVAPAATHPAHPAHVVPLAGGWALWRTVCLRGAGFPIDLLAPLADAALSLSADQVLLARSSGDRTEVERAEAAYAVEFDRATARLGRALRTAATLPTFREAVAWQNRHALATGVDALLRRDPARVRGTKHRQHEALVASYLQRYCAKNDTIGFFGPVGWSHIDDGRGIRLTRDADDRPLAARTVYLQGWAVNAVMAAHTAALRPWLVPRRMPFVALVGTTLRVPLAPPVVLTPAAAAVLRACDGSRDANEVAAVVLADPGSGLSTTKDVFDVLTWLSDHHRLAWRPEVPAYDIHPERSMRAQLDRVADETVRAPALAALDRLCAGRDALARAAGDGQRVAREMAALEETFTRLTGTTATRRAGQLYAGRTLAYEECLRSGTITFGAQMLADVAEPLALVLDSARWFTAISAALVRRAFTDIYRRRAAELGSAAVPFADLWLLGNDLLFEPPPRLVAPLVRALQQRWAGIFALPAGQRRVRLATNNLRPLVRAAFPPTTPGWPTAIHHSPDLMIIDTEGTEEVGRSEWVLGELHPGVNTMRYATWVAYQESPDGLRAAMRADLGRGVIYPAETDEEGGVPARQSNALTGPDDLRLIFAQDGCGYEPTRSLVVGEWDVIESATGLRVRRRDGGGEYDLMEVIGELIAAGLAQRFRLLAPAAHTPRLSIDSLVVSRETWTFTATQLSFASTASEARRFLQVRAWLAEHGLPRHVFVRCAGEAKPIYADLTSLASIDLLSRAVRRAQRTGGDAAQVSVVEMLPAPDQLWLRDTRGCRYATELRVLAVDRSGGATP